MVSYSLQQLIILPPTFTGTFKTIISSFYNCALIPTMRILYIINIMDNITKFTILKYTMRNINLVYL